MHELAAIEAAQHVAPPLRSAAMPSAAVAGCRRSRSRRRRLQLLQRVGGARIDGFLAPSFCAAASFASSMSQPTMLRPRAPQHRDADEAQPAAAEHRDRIRLVELGQLGGRAVGGERRAGERRGEGIVDAGGVEQVLRVGHEHVRGIGAGRFTPRKRLPETQ
jgi:hypothetical protein